MLATVQWLQSRQELATARAVLTSFGKAVDHQAQPPTPELVRLALEVKAWDLAAAWLKPLVAGEYNSEATQLRAFALSQAGRFAESAALYDRVIRAEPLLHSAKIDKAICLQAWGAWEQATRLLRQVLVDPSAPARQRAMAQYKLGWHLVREGEFKKGMAWNKIGRRLRHWGAYSGRYEAPMLADGEDVQGKTILVAGEAGRGDEILNFRFGRHLRERGARVIYLLCHKDLGELLRRHPEFFDVLLTAGEEATPRYDRWVAAQDLPVTLDLNAHQIGNQPYLTVSPSSSRKWGTLLAEKRRPRVGLRWRGDAEVDREQGRALPESEIGHLVERFPHVDFYSFEVDPHTLPHPRIHRLQSNLESWNDTAAALAQMDLLISSCTAVVHLAGALGVPTWVLAQTIPYYIWAEESGPSSWYASVTPIKKQKTEWSGSFAQLQQLLSGALHSPLTRASDIGAIEECRI